MTSEATVLIERRARRACVLALAALGLIVWSLVDAAPVVSASPAVDVELGNLALAVAQRGPSTTQPLPQPRLHE